MLPANQPNDVAREEFAAQFFSILFFSKYFIDSADREPSINDINRQPYLAMALFFESQSV